MDMTKVREQVMDEESMSWLQKGGWAVFSRHALTAGGWDAWKLQWPVGQDAPEGIFLDKAPALEFAAALLDEYGTQGLTTEVMVVETSPILRRSLQAPK